MEDLLRQIRDGSVMTSAALPGGATGFTIEFADEDRDVALDTMRALLLRMSDNTAKLKAAADDGGRCARCACAADRQAGPNRGLFTGAGMGCGLLAGFIDVGGRYATALSTRSFAARVVRPGATIRLPRLVAGGLLHRLFENVALEGLHGALVVEAVCGVDGTARVPGRKDG